MALQPGKALLFFLNAVFNIIALLFNSLEPFLWNIPRVFMASIFFWSKQLAGLADKSRFLQTTI